MTQSRASLGRRADASLGHEAARWRLLAQRLAVGVFGADGRPVDALGVGHRVEAVRATDVEGSVPVGLTAAVPVFE